jgi:hypothetical protein
MGWAARANAKRRESTAAVLQIEKDAAHRKGCTCLRCRPIEDATPGLSDGDAVFGQSTQHVDQKTGAIVHKVGHMTVRIDPK